MNWLESLGFTRIPPKHRGKSVSTSSIGVGSEEGTTSTSQHKWDQKISAQSSQIKDLHTKLDGAVAENIQIWELLGPATYKWPLLTHFRLHSLVREIIVAVILRLIQVNLFWVSPGNPSSQLGRMVALTQTRPATIARTLGMMCIIVFVCKSERHS